MNMPGRAGVRIGKELTVKLGGTRGHGAALFAKFKEARINIVASACYQIEDQAIFSIVVEEPDRANTLLRDCGYQPRSEPVLLIEMPNQPGALADALGQISALGVNVTSAYATTTAKEVALVVLKTEDNDRVLAELSGPASDQADS